MKKISIALGVSMFIIIVIYSIIFIKYNSNNGIKTADEFSDIKFLSQSNISLINKYYSYLGINKSEKLFNPDKLVTRIQALKAIKKIMDDRGIKQNSFNYILKFSDIAENDEDYSIIQDVASFVDSTGTNKNHKINSYLGFKLQKTIPITRLEFASLASKLLSTNTSIQAKNFKDVSKEFQKEADLMYSYGIMLGTSGTTFGSNDNMNRLTFMIILDRIENIPIISQ